MIRVSCSECALTTVVPNVGSALDLGTATPGRPGFSHVLEFECAGGAADD